MEGGKKTIGNSARVTKKLCQYSINGGCTRKDCKFEHPASPEKAKGEHLKKNTLSLCAFYPKCTNQTCRYLHVDVVKEVAEEPSVTSLIHRFRGKIWNLQKISSSYETLATVGGPGAAEMTAKAERARAMLQQFQAYMLTLCSDVDKWTADLGEKCVDDDDTSSNDAGESTAWTM